MNGYEFWSSVIHSLAWPLALIGAIFMLRTGITTFLSNVEKLRAKIAGNEFEAEAHKDIARAEAVAEVTQANTTRNPVLPAENPQEPLASEPIDSTEPRSSAREQVRTNNIFDFDLIQRLAVISPRSAIQEAWLTIEGRIHTLYVSTAGESGTYARGPSTVRQASNLIEEGIVPRYLDPLLTELRYVRNRAVHESNYEITPDDAIRYAQLALTVFRELNRADALARGRANSTISDGIN